MEDRIGGMFMGVFLGDALGHPHEFRCNANVPYTCLLQHKAFRTSRFQGRVEYQIGQVSDDSEMTLALLHTLIRDKQYIKDNVLLAYLNWANSDAKSMGKNTRELLKGVTTIRGYTARFNKLKEASQSNGTLMRATPLALLKDNNSIITEVYLTNPSPVVADCEIIYVIALKLALQGHDGVTIFNSIKNIAQTNEVREVLAQVQNRTYRDVTGKTKGWCLHAFYITFIVITGFNNFSSAMQWIITQPGSDTDTNAAIAGGLLGAILGLNKMKQEPLTNQNINILLNADINNGPMPRPPQYIPGTNFNKLISDAYELTK